MNMIQDVFRLFKHPMVLSAMLHLPFYSLFFSGPASRRQISGLLSVTLKQDCKDALQQRVHFDRFQQLELSQRCLTNMHFLGMHLSNNSIFKTGNLFLYISSCQNHLHDSLVTQLFLSFSVLTT